MLLRFDLNTPPPVVAHGKTHRHDPEPALIARARNGDVEAITNLYERYAPQLLRYITARLGNPDQAEEESNPPAQVHAPPKQNTVLTVLVVDDFEPNRNTLARNLKMQGHIAVVAENGYQALELLRSRPFDLMLLDIVMPQMDGYQVMKRMREDPALRHIPVIVVSGVDEMDCLVRCVELGAEDYLFKPFDPVLLKARVRACMEKKQLRDQEQAYLSQLQAEREKSERLLLNILPAPIAERLKHDQSIIAESFDEVTVLFADIVNFTPLAARVAPADLVRMLNEIFSLFDHLAERLGLEKIKTIGDAYMVVGGLPTPRADHATAIAEMALAMRAAVAGWSAKLGESLRIRIGISSGPAVAGVIGTRKFAYDLWGDTVNTASRMEALGRADCIHVSAATYELLREQYRFEKRGPMQVKGKGEMVTYFLAGRKADEWLIAEADGADTIELGGRLILAGNRAERVPV